MKIVFVLVFTELGQRKRARKSSMNSKTIWTTTTETKAAAVMMMMIIIMVVAIVKESGSWPDQLCKDDQPRWSCIDGARVALAEAGRGHT